MPAMTMTAYATDNNANWGYLKTAMSGETQATVGGVIEVENNTPTAGTITITLLSDITAGENDSALAVPSGKKIVLDLNGHTINRNLNEATANGFVVNVEGNLTIKDIATGGGKITGGNNKCVYNKPYGGGVSVASGGELTMTGGEITGNFSVKADDDGGFGGGVYVNKNGSFNMSGGKITDNMAEAHGGGVHIGENATFKMTGGEISGNSSSTNGAGGVFSQGNCIMSGNSIISHNSGTGVNANKGTFTMSGNSIISYNSTTNVNAGGLIIGQGGEFTMSENSRISYNSSTGSIGGANVNIGTFKMTGGSIDHNTGGFAGGVLANGNVTIGGTAKITDNKLSSNNTASNVYLANNKYIALDTGNAPASGMKVGVTTQNSPAEGTPKKFTTNGTENDLQYFFSDKADYYVNFNTNEKYLELKKPVAGNHAINIIPSEHGSVSASAQEASENACITLTVTPDSGYELSANSLKVISGDGTEITVTKSGNAYTFTMPSNAVTVSAKFKRLPDWKLLSKALSNETQGTVDGLFEVTESSGTRTITLLSDITATSADSALVVPEGKKIVLDLNGKIINANGGAFSVIQVENGGKLTVIDNKPETEHKGYVEENGLWHLGTPQSGETEKDIKGGIITGSSNPSNGNGGGVYADGSFTMNGGNIAGNTVKHGGGVYVYTAGNFTMEGGTIYGNKASMNSSCFGGGVYALGSFTMTGGTISGNSACNGGGICAMGTATLSDALIENNSSKTGGGILNYGSNLVVDRCTIRNNKATSYGGGISNNGNNSIMYENGTGTISNTVITGNTANYGGGIHNGYQTILKDNVTITGNTATSLGGGISGYGQWGYDNNGQITFAGKNIVIKDNICTNNQSLANLTVENNTVSSPNRAYPVNITAALTGSVIYATVFNGTAPVTGLLTSGFTTKNEGAKLGDFFHYDGPNTYYIDWNTDNTDLVVKEVPAGSYTISIPTITNGKVTADKQIAASGDSVTLTVTPDSGYELEKLTYTYEGNTTPIDITSTKSFTMPGKAVTITATFKESTEPGPTPGPDPEPTPAEEEYKAPVEGENTVNVNTTITDGMAKVEEISQSTLEEAVNPKSGTETTDTLVIDLSQAKQDVTAVELTKKTVENLADVVASDKNTVETVTIQMKEATVEMDAKTLETISEEANGNTIVLVVDKTQSEELTTAKQETLKDYNVNKTFEAYFESNGHRIHDFKGGVATVSIKFEPTQGSDVNNYKIYYLDDSAKMHKYATKYKDGMLVFATTHFSDYVIVYEGKTDVLLAQAKSTNGKIKLSWNGLDNITKYVVYGARCGHNYKKLKTTTGKSYTVKKASGKKLKAHKVYKFYVVAYDAVGNKVQSRSIHYVYKNTQGKYANVKSIKAKYDNLLLSVGVTQKISAKYKMYSGKKHLKKAHGQALKFFSNNTDVATVSSGGTVKAVGKGTATIYIQDIGGKYCKTKVTVE